jgi:hypothetical protein
MSNTIVNSGLRCCIGFCGSFPLFLFISSGKSQSLLNFISVHKDPCSDAVQLTNTALDATPSKTKGSTLDAQLYWRLYKWLKTLKRVWSVATSKYVSQDIIACSYPVVYLTI